MMPPAYRGHQAGQGGRCGTRIAYTVKPGIRLRSGRFLEDMGEVAWWVRKKGFADYVRFLTDADVDPVALHNAKVIAAVRAPDPEADAAARRAADALVGGASLLDLTAMTGLEARGYRDVLEAEIVPYGRGYVFRFGYVQLNTHDPDQIGFPRAKLPVLPGGSDLRFEWHGALSGTVAHLQRCGVEMDLGPIERTGAQGLGQRVYFRDPDASLLEIISYQP